MIDTVNIYCYELDQALLDELEEYILRKMAIYKGAIVYIFDILPYQNTYTNKIQIKIKDEKWEYDQERKIAVKVKCKKYIEIEGSLHKLYLGHNCYGGSDNIKYQVEGLLMKIKEDLKLKNDLPEYKNWYINRIDYAKIYKTGNQNNVRNYFNSLRNIHYPRGHVQYYAGEAIYRGGRTTGVKIYNKYVEYMKHGYNNLKRLSIDYANEVMENVIDIIRCEVEIKKNKLKYDFQKKEIKLSELTLNYLESIYKVEIKRLLNEGEDVRKLKNNNDVRIYLMNNLSGNKFNIIYGFYNDLCINGVDEVKKSISKSTFYRNMKILKNYGINYKNNDIVITNNYQFNPLYDPDYNIDLIAV